MSLTDEEIKEIADRAVASTMKDMKKHKEAANKANKRNGLLAFVLGAIITLGGFLSLSAGIGIYLLIAGIMLFGLSGFLFLLILIN